MYVMYVFKVCSNKKLVLPIELEILRAFLMDTIFLLVQKSDRNPNNTLVMELAMYGSEHRRPLWKENK
jgi:hypothetical protein